MAKDFTDHIVSSLTATNQLLFDVYAYAQPADVTGSGVLIGSIFSRGAATKSFFGDTQLMFAHNDFAKDVELNPSWADAAPQYTPNIFEIDLNENPKIAGYSPVVGSGKCPFGF